MFSLLSCVFLLQLSRMRVSTNVSFQPSDHDLGLELIPSCHQLLALLLFPDVPRKISSKTFLRIKGRERSLFQAVPGRTPSFDSWDFGLYLLFLKFSLMAWRGWHFFTLLKSVFSDFRIKVHLNVYVDAGLSGYLLPARFLCDVKHMERKWWETRLEPWRFSGRDAGHNALGSLVGGFHTSHIWHSAVLCSGAAHKPPTTTSHGSQQSRTPATGLWRSRRGPWMSHGRSPSPSK